MSAIPIVQIVGNSDGGGTRFVVDIMERVDRARFHFTLIAPQSEWLAKSCADAGATFRPLPLMSSRVSAALSREFRSIVADEAPTIVHAHGTRAAWLATRSLSRGARTPALIYSEHLFSMDARRGLLKIPWYAIERAICRRADFITTGCDANADRAERAGWTTEDHIAVRRYGVDQAAIRAQGAQRITRTQLGVPRDALLVGSVGRLIPQKGFTYLLRAMKRVISQHPRAYCLVVGDGPLRATLEEESRKLGIAEQVKFLGERSAPWSVLACCDVIALPSLFEGLWLALIEALTLGLPVVATKTGGATELLVNGHNGMLAPPRNASALAVGLMRVLDDPALQQAFHATGPASVADYDLGPVIHQIEVMYQLATHKTTHATGQARSRT